MSFRLHYIVIKALDTRIRYNNKEIEKCDWRSQDNVEKNRQRKRDTKE